MIALIPFHNVADASCTSRSLVGMDIDLGLLELACGNPTTEHDVNLSVASTVEVKIRVSDSPPDDLAQSMTDPFISGKKKKAATMQRSAVPPHTKPHFPPRLAPVGLSM